MPAPAKALFLACLLVLAASCSRDRDVSTLFVGDSVTYLSAGQINERFEDPHFVAKPGFTTAELVPLAESQRASDQTIILTGYNDVLQGKVDRAPVEALADAVDKDQCIVWFTLPDVPLHSADAERYNAIVRSVVEDRGSNFHLSESWSKRATSETGLLNSADLVHPNEAGQLVLAKLYRQGALESCRN